MDELEDLERQPRERFSLCPAEGAPPQPGFQSFLDAIWEPQKNMEIGCGSWETRPGCSTLS
jgi:hypothetical protein